jgi:hypothetical protein
MFLFHRGITEEQGSRVAIETGEDPEVFTEGLYRGKREREKSACGMTVYEDERRQEIPPDPAVPGKAITTRYHVTCEKGMARCRQK